MNVLAALCPLCVIIALLACTSTVSCDCSGGPPAAVTGLVMCHPLCVETAMVLCANSVVVPVVSRPLYTSSVPFSKFRKVPSGFKKI